MLAPFSKLIDWCAIQVTSRQVPEINNRNLRLEQALQFLKAPDFIPQESEPSQIEFNGPLHFRFPAPRPSEFSENNIGYGRFYRCGDPWRERPTIILLHGWDSVLSHKFRFPWIARRCNQTGFNALTLELPTIFSAVPGNLERWVVMTACDLQSEQPKR
jgi:hypothetical protein